MTKKRKAAKASRKKKSSRTRLSVAFSATRPPKQRVAALSQAPLAICETDKNLQSVLRVVRDTTEPVEVRLAAMDALATAAFSAVAFEPCRPDYIEALQDVSEDPDPKIRESALGLLVGEKNKYAQKKLLEGLKKPEKALVPPEKALQLLGSDIHAESYAVARDIVSKPPSEVAKREALRLLAADATSTPLFEKLLRDKNESREIRQISASALHAINPKKLQAHARAMLLDDSDYDDIRATSLSAVEQFGDQETVAKDTELLKHVDRMSKAAPTKYKKSARQFLSKYGR
jgi:HEAT repeat protein